MPPASATLAPMQRIGRLDVGEMDAREDVWDEAYLILLVMVGDYCALGFR